MYSLADSLAHASLSLPGPSYTKAIKTRQPPPSLVSSFRPVSKKIELCHRRVSKCSVEKTVAPDLVWCTGASCCCQPPASARCGRMSENPVIFWVDKGLSPDYKRPSVHACYYKPSISPFGFDCGFHQKTRSCAKRRLFESQHFWCECEGL